jgi:hypothetical protein
LTTSTDNKLKMNIKYNFLLLYFYILCFTQIQARELGGIVHGKLVPQKPGGIGFAFSGAGGRIAQHLALMEALLNGSVDFIFM